MCHRTFRTYLRNIFTRRRNAPDAETMHEPPAAFEIEPLPYGDHVFHLELYEIPEQPLSANNPDFEDSDVTPLPAGATLRLLFAEIQDYLNKAEGYGIDRIMADILDQVYEDTSRRPGTVQFAQEISLLVATESSHGLVTPFSELELGNTKDYPFPEHFRRWKDSRSVASVYDSEAAWELMKGPDPAPYTTPIHISVRTWSHRIVGSISCIVFCLVCCFI